MISHNSFGKFWCGAFRGAGLALALAVAGPTQADYSAHPGAQALVDEMVAEHGFSREELQSVFMAAERQQSILDAISRPAEKTKPWHQYRDIFLTERREQEGIAFFAQHREALARAQAETGVPAEVIVAIIGVETYYGRIAGSYDVIDALSTLAFDYPKRSPFFTSELKNFLLLAREQGMDPLTLRGSYAGAMGYGQFMPSSYRAYAVDFDGDAVADIWNNPTDAIGSVANYLAKHGWQAAGPVVSAASASASIPEEAFEGGLKPTRDLRTFMDWGLVPEQQLDPASLATAMRFELADGYEYWLGLQNLYVITRYNHSSMYAMSVYLLSQRIAAGLPG
ncbi:MAG: lytic murein transglycosylase B [Congregibacter sp.]|nr:lytic murein transglycosylase B [Congregibacter sp.]MDP5069780.1 lytic murein transglycosylase B [Congregibacter sp.]